MPPSGGRKNTLNAAAKVVGSVLGRITSKVDALTHPAAGAPPAPDVEAILEHAHAQPSNHTPTPGKIGAVAEVAHAVKPQPQRVRKASGRRPSAAKRQKPAAPSRAVRRSRGAKR